MTNSENHDPDRGPDWMRHEKEEWMMAAGRNLKKLPPLMPWLSQEVKEEHYSGVAPHAKTAWSGLQRMLEEGLYRPRAGWEEGEGEPESGGLICAAAMVGVAVGWLTVELEESAIIEQRWKQQKQVEREDNKKTTIGYCPTKTTRSWNVKEIMPALMKRKATRRRRKKTG
ncbi:OLC1v1004984C1 [Oldenlandia corymbosa var. corymbosa]|uniref:OLC1v1004984C1 n=1 Tax=Oldenlandia corymbosa var. corymbosa TaxID=529605 RepID=A0AAV1DGI9_OLDCO|nr:OLC1v1004984C1 [Oldenlandia corymbosa var. corymbosa]